MLVEKTDRLYRNLKDWVTMDELDVEMHFPKEGVVLSREFALLGKVHARHQGSDGEELHRQFVRGSPQGHAGKGGTRHLADQDATRLSQHHRPGRQRISRLPTAVAPIVAKLFDEYASGGISLKEAAKKAQAAGLVYAQSGAKVPVSTVHAILRNRLYTGRFEWNSKTYQGKHEPLVPIDLWERVQEVLDGRFARKAKQGQHDFAFSGLIACHACGCAVVGEIKKERYVYYHCTGYADKCQGNPATCRRKYMREEAPRKAVHGNARAVRV